jgi:energy-coupling factor transport system permease protein
MYQGSDTAIHRLNPYTKLIFALSFSISAFIAYTLWIQAALFLFCLLLLYLSRSLARVFKATYRFTLFFVFVLFAVQALFWSGGGPIWEAGPLTIHLEGILFSMQVTLRLLTILCSFYLLMATTHPANLVVDLEQRGLPPRLGFVMLATLQAITEIQERAKTIMDVQKCRGVEVQGGLMVRARAYFPLIAPLIIGSILDIESRALALELRGFSAGVQKTYLHDSDERPWERLLRGALILLPVFILFSKLVWRTR